MNFLAHAYLSFKQEEILVDNLISDFVKGKKRYDYPQNIQAGIELHRRIDAFTDVHPCTLELKSFFKSSAGSYAAVFGDVVYDYFLANSPEAFDEGELRVFADEVYAVLYKYYDHLPNTFAAMLPYMKQQDWLFNYRSHWGIERSFEGIVKRALYLKDAKPAYNVFIEYCDRLQPLFDEFFPEMKTYAFEQLQTLSSQSQ